MPECSERDCDDPAAVLLHVPWDEDRAVCPAHARSATAQDGVVAEPLEDADEELPEGSASES